MFRRGVRVLPRQSFCCPKGQAKNKAETCIYTNSTAVRCGNYEASFMLHNKGLNLQIKPQPSKLLKKK